MIGQTVRQYRILEQLGRGGMGVVYKARDTRLDRLVALKFLPPGAEADDDARRRFLQEARAIAALDHPSVAAVHEIAETEDGRAFIVMPFYEGRTLERRLAEGRPTTAEAIRTAAAIASGLAAAHERGVVHRDLKPANVILTAAGGLRIVDFGLARLAGATRLTRDGTTVGTVAYMSPEQARGDRVDGRSDLFSLGVILYEMLAGERPFRGEHEAAVLYAIQHRDPEPLRSLDPALPASLQAVVDRLLARDPERRYRSARDLLRDLRRLFPRETAGGLAAPRPGPWRRHRRAIGLAAAGAAILVAGFALLGEVTRWPHGRQERVAEVFGIVVAPFWGADEQALEEGRLLQQLVQGRIAALVDDPAAVRLTAPAVPPPRTGAEARALGERIDGSLVVWGDVIAIGDELEISPRLTVVRAGEGGAWRTVDRDSALAIDLAEPGQIQLRRGSADRIGELALLAAARYHRRPAPLEALAMLDRIEPPTAESLLLRGAILVDLDRLDAAGAAYDRATELAPDDRWAWLGVGWLRDRRGDEAGALAAYERARAADPGSAVPLYHLGMAYVGLERYAEAEAAFTRAIELDPASVQPRLGLGWLAFERGDADAAVARYEQAAALAPASPLPYLRLGELYGLYLGRHEDAIAAYREAARLDPDNLAALHALARQLAFVGRDGEAERLLRRCIAMEPMQPGPRVSLARIEAGRGHWRSALARMEETVALRPELPGVHLDLAYLHRDHGDTTAAVRQFRATLALDPRDFPALLGLADLYRALGRVREADSLLTAAVEAEDTGGVPVRFFVANNLLFAGRLERAIAMYRAVVAQDSSWGLPLYFLGEAYRLSGRLDEAIAAFGRAAALEPDLPEAVLAGYLAACRAGRPDEAEAILRPRCGPAGRPRDVEADFAWRVVDFFCGATSEEGLRRAAREADAGAPEGDLRRVAYYLGLARLCGALPDALGAAPDVAAARRDLRRCAYASSAEFLAEGELARLELERLDGQLPRPAGNGGG